jgi:hypothetical protein
LKTVGEVWGLRKCYQCGGETLVPVVKHSVSDSTSKSFTSANVNLFIRRARVSAINRDFFSSNEQSR